MKFIVSVVNYGSYPAGEFSLVFCEEIFHLFKGHKNLVKLFFCVSCHIACPDESSSIRDSRANSHVCENTLFLKYHCHDKAIIIVIENYRDYSCSASSYL